MKHIVYLILALLFTGCGITSHDDKSGVDKIQVGVFNKNGDSPGCIIDACEALRIDAQMEVSVVSAADLMAGRLNAYDVILFPGGGGKSETNSLGEQGMARIKSWVKQDGKGIVGICAGAYILTNTPEYPSLGLSGGEAIDIEHDHRGNGLVSFSLSEPGYQMFPELKGMARAWCQYYEGPVLKPSHDEIQYTALATMLSDVHLIAGTPANMTNDKPFIITSEPGEGRTCSFVGHPECTPGMRWMVPRMVRWVAKKPLVTYGKQVVRPGIYSHDILFNDSLKALQYQYFDDLFSTPDNKMMAIESLTAMRAWSAKKWFMGLLRDDDATVRVAAANALVELERTDAIDDLKVAVMLEQDEHTKKILKERLKRLENMVGCSQSL